MYKIDKRAMSIIAVLLFLDIILACQLTPSEKEREMSSDYGEYTFNPDKILSSIAHGDSDVFTPLVEGIDSPPIQYSNSAKWESTDFLYVAQNFHEFHWKESTETWDLNLIEYLFDCRNIDRGPYFSQLWFFKIGRTRGQDSRFEHTIQISLSDNTIYWSEAEMYPATKPSRLIDLAQIRISAEVAVRIAEDNGGKEARFGVDNKCTVNVMLAPGASEKKWLVKYSTTSEHDHLLEVDIDQSTGKHEVVYPEK